MNKHVSHRINSQLQPLLAAFRNRIVNIDYPKQFIYIMKIASLATAALWLSAASHACLLPEELGQESFKGQDTILRRQNSNNHGVPIGTGDRFEGGAKFPRGLGTQPKGTFLGNILSLKEVESAFKGLQKEYGFQTFEAPIKTHENRTIYGGKLGNKADCRDRYSVYLQAGLQ